MGVDGMRQEGGGNIGRVRRGEAAVDGLLESRLNWRIEPGTAWQVAAWCKTGEGSFSSRGGMRTSGGVVLIGNASSSAVSEWARSAVTWPSLPSTGVRKASTTASGLVEKNSSSAVMCEPFSGVGGVQLTSLCPDRRGLRPR